MFKGLGSMGRGGGDDVITNFVKTIMEGLSQRQNKSECYLYPIINEIARQPEHSSSNADFLRRVKGSDSWGLRRVDRLSPLRPNILRSHQLYLT